ncbi:hypothetical protein QOZ80_2AG0110190 [Eleusine coracana subsp. coracana]|nr:hypothetical protein QOZ80_2AG0110190 [Eleusine coracana subsp. coracana]
MNVAYSGRKACFEVGTLQCGAWTFQSTATMDVLGIESATVVVGTHKPAQGKIYLMTKSGYILVLVLASMSLSVLQLPDEVKTRNFQLSCRDDDSGFFLIHGEGCLISVWRHEAVGNGTHDWMLVYDIIRVHEAFNRQEDVLVLGADDNLEYVILGLKESKCLISVHLRSRTEKVHEFTVNSIPYTNVKPFMMVWPPAFPAAREENVLEEG